jgi:hypothetical protein
MLTHIEEFSDKWAIKTVEGQEILLARLTVSGSDGSDGTFPSDLGSPINLIITGTNWRITMVFQEILAFGGPLPSQIRRFVSFDLQNGLVKTFTDVPGGLFVLEDGLPVLSCKNLDPSVNPFKGAVNPFDFTIDRKMLHEPRYQNDGRKN